MANRWMIRLFEHRWRIVFLLFSPLLYFPYKRLSYQFDEEFGIGPEHPVYTIPPRPADDTLRVAIIGDSWAEYHTTLNCDTIFCKMAKKHTTSPVKCFSRGHSAKMTKEIYNNMFRDHTIEHEWDVDRCTQPLIEQHPDYCVIMAGINDMRKYRPTDFYTGYYKFMLHVLLRNGIRPVVMEMPDVDFREAMNGRKYYEQWIYGLLSVWTKIDYNSAQTYRNSLRTMLDQTGLKDSVLFIPVAHWNPGGVDSAPHIYLSDRFHLNLEGYHVLDSCMATDIINDYQKRKTEITWK